MRKKFPTTRENFPACPCCTSGRVMIQLLTFYVVYFRCEECEHTWNVANDDIRNEHAVGA